MRRPHRYSAAALDYARVLGMEIGRSRRERRMTAQELAERAGISLVTLRKVERGDPTVAVGTVFEVAVLVGVPLFDANRTDLPDLVQRARERLALLPARVREPLGPVRNDF